MNTLYNHRTHAFQLMGHETPVLSPVRVSLELVPFDQSPSLHPLRNGWRSRLVRELRGYYDSVRLPMFVHRQITSLDLLTRSARHLADKHRLSRFSRRLFLYMLRFFDRAGFGGPSRFRDLRYGVTTENFVRISTGSFWDDDRDSVGASRSFRQITRGSKVSVFLTRQVDEYVREM